MILTNFDMFSEGVETTNMMRNFEILGHPHIVIIIVDTI